MSSKQTGKFRTVIYWLPPLMVLLACGIGVWYSLTAPSQTLSFSNAAGASNAEGAAAGNATANATANGAVNAASNTGNRAANAAANATANGAIQALIPPVTPAMHEYSRIRYAIHFIWIALEVAFLWAFLQFGWSGKLASFSTSRTRFLFFRLAIFVFGFSLIMSITFSPFSYLTGFWLKHHYGLSDQSLLNWTIDWCKAFAVNFCVELPIWWLIYKALTKFPKRWPYLVFVGSVPVIFALTFMAPLVVDPVFNKIEPMPSTELRASIERLAVASGIIDAPIFTCDRHKQTNEINAYVTGLGSSARIVVWDTTLRKLPPDEILCVVSHELGHYVLKHVYWGCGIAVLVSLLLVPVNIWITPRLFKGAPSVWRITSIRDIAGVPLFLLTISIVGFISEPIVNGYSRGVEHEADMFGLKLFGNRQAFARTFASLSRDNLAEPNPPKLIEFWLYSHPSLGERIKSALVD